MEAGLSYGCFAYKLQVSNVTRTDQQTPLDQQPPPEGHLLIFNALACIFHA